MNPGVHDAHASLLGAASARDRLAGRACWGRSLYAVLAAGSTAVVLTAGLADVTAVLAVTGAFLAATAVMVVRVVRQGVVPRGFARLHVTAMVVWGIVFSAALQTGLNMFPGVPAYWILAAVVVAAPLVVAAVLAGRAAVAR